MPGIVIEILVPDFNGKDDALAAVMEARPAIFNHNLETVERLTPLVQRNSIDEGYLDLGPCGYKSSAAVEAAEVAVEVINRHSNMPNKSIQEHA